MSVVFTDTFTVGANINLNAYPSGAADYALNMGTATEIVVIAATDKVHVSAEASSAACRIIDASVPTGDQKITADVTADAGDWGWPCARMNAAGTANFYLVEINTGEANEVRIYRCDNGSFSLLASADRGLTAGIKTTSLEATGTTTVSLECICAGTAAVTATDSTGSRKTSGPPGIGGGETGTIDNVEVDDLASAGGGGDAFHLIPESIAFQPFTGIH